MYKQFLIVIIAVFSFTQVSFAQNMDSKHAKMEQTAVKNVTLEQTKGAFSVAELTLEAGSYQFEIVNNNVGTDVGFVVAPATNPDAHIKEAYVTEVVKNNSSQKTNVVNLTPGEYIYFCPLNKTPQYKLTVK